METSYLGASDDPSSLPVRDEGDLKICQVLKEVNRHSKVYSCLHTDMDEPVKPLIASWAVLSGPSRESPGRTGVKAGATTAHGWPSPVSCRWTSYPHGPAS